MDLDSSAFPNLQFMPQDDFEFDPAVVASIRFPLPQPKIRSFSFAASSSNQQGFAIKTLPDSHAHRTAGQPAFGIKQTNSVSNSSGGLSNSQGVTSCTRLKPPKDIVKLDDRLFCLLQPPLEVILQNATVEFPFSPFSHQFSGIAFLFLRHFGILADEMGLGKTMQTISAIRLLMRSDQLKNVLLICPKPLVTNWVREFNLWAPEIPTTKIEGNRAKREFLWQQDLPVKIANYELISRDLPMIQQTDLVYDLIALDEAQRIKNRHSNTSKSVCQLPRRRSWALTGTPIENSIEDLVGIFEFLSPGYVTSGMETRAMRSRVRDYVLRRTKSEVLTDLPPLMNRDELLALAPSQQAAYQQAESNGVVSLNELGDSMTVTHVFELVLRLKQICNFEPVTGDSAKLQRLKANLEEIIASGQKTIVFSQWVKTLQRIADYIPEANPLQYHGKIPSAKRDGVLDEFKNNPDRHVILISYGAGSVGLNLQFCRYVFLFDQWWNPAVEDQAINRAHRIGSTGSVTVTRMISEGTIEERINDVLQEKRELFESILSDTDRPAEMGLSKEEIFGLFDLRAGGKRLQDVA